MDIPILSDRKTGTLAPYRCQVSTIELCFFTHFSNGDSVVPAHCLWDPPTFPAPEAPIKKNNNNNKKAYLQKGKLNVLKQNQEIKVRMRSGSHLTFSLS